MAVLEEAVEGLLEGGAVTLRVGRSIAARYLDWGKASLIGQQFRRLRQHLSGHGGDRF